MKKVVCLAAVIVLLAGCAWNKDIVYVDRPVIVEKPVPQKCIAKEDYDKLTEKTWPLDAVDLDGDFPLARTVNAARQERKMRKEYTTAVGEVLKRCAD
jgi:hypothetical protein